MCLVALFVLILKLINFNFTSMIKEISNDLYKNLNFTIKQITTDFNNTISNLTIGIRIRTNPDYN